MALLGLLLMLALPPGQQVQADNECQKNILIYFDASGSMLDLVSGRPLMSSMLDFLSSAINDTTLIRDNDRVVFKKFVRNRQDFNQLNQQFVIDRASRTEITNRIARLKQNEAQDYNQIILRRQDNNYVNLVQGIRRDIRSFPPPTTASSYIIIFSDFFFDPSLNNPLSVAAHRRSLQRELGASFDDYLAQNGYRLILIYKPNPTPANPQARTDDVFSVFNALDHSSTITTTGNTIVVSEIISELQNRFVEGIGANGRLVFENGQLQANLDLRNPNCESLPLSQASIAPISSVGDSTVLLSTGTSTASINQTIGPSSILPISVPLAGGPSLLSDLETLNLIGKRYQLDVTLQTDDGREIEAAAELSLNAEDFCESFALEQVEAIVVDNIRSRFDKLFVRVGFNGTVLNDSRFTINPTIPNYSLPDTLDHSWFDFAGGEPIRDDKNEQVYVYEIRPDEGYALSSIDSVRLTLNARRQILDLRYGRACSPEPLLQTVRVEYKNYIKAEWIAIILLVVLSFVTSFLAALKNHSS